jgi:Domain of unknown function (DUF4271)
VKAPKRNSHTIKMMMAVFLMIILLPNLVLSQKSKIIVPEIASGFLGTNYGFAIALVIPAILAILHFRLPNYWVGLLQKLNPLAKERFNINSEVVFNKNLILLLNIIFVIILSTALLGVKNYYDKAAINHQIGNVFSATSLFTIFPIILVSVLKWLYDSKFVMSYLQQTKLLQRHITLLTLVPLFCLVLVRPNSIFIPFMTIATFSSIFLVWIITYYKLSKKIYEWRALSSFNILYYLCICEALPIVVFVVFYFRL